jgi:hypothetical protein
LRISGNIADNLTTVVLLGVEFCSSRRRRLFSVSFLHFHPPLLEPTIQSSSSSYSMTVEKLVFSFGAI